MPLCLLPAQNAGGEAALFVVWALMMAFGMTVSLVSLGLMVWAIVDLVRNPRLTDNERLLWVIVIVFVGCVGPALYLLIGRTMKPSRPPDVPTEPTFGPRHGA